MIVLREALAALLWNRVSQLLPTGWGHCCSMASDERSLQKGGEAPMFPPDLFELVASPLLCL